MLRLEPGLGLLPKQKLVLAVDTPDIHRPDLLEVGRQVTEAEDMVTAYQAIAHEVESAANALPK